MSLIIEFLCSFFLAVCLIAVSAIPICLTALLIDAVRDYFACRKALTHYRQRRGGTT